MVLRPSLFCMLRLAGGVLRLPESGQNHGAGGGGQPIHDGEELAGKREDALWKLDQKATIRFSHENPEIQSLYQEFLERPLGKKSHHLLHTDHTTWEVVEKGIWLDSN
mgnify:CR=1 FL=1